MKTKAILSSLLVCIVTTLPAQINLNDSTVQVVAYWSKGDSYDYLYDYYKYNIQGKDTISWERTISKINITVIDSTENSYTLQAVYDTPNAIRSGSDSISRELTSRISRTFGNDTVIVETNELGTIKRLVNFDKLRSRYLKAAEMTAEALSAQQGSEAQKDSLFRFLKSTLSKQMGDTTVKAADHISMKINKGEFVAIVGQSGSGKSTCMNIIGCLDVPTAGTYRLNGRDVGKMNKNELAEIRNEMLGFIFQQYNLLPKLSLLENVEVPLVYAGIPLAERKRRATASLERVGLGDKLKNKPNQLSGGQQQRVSIARALAGNPAIILADEPTGALDSHTGREVLGMLQELHRQGNTVVLITHDNSIAVQAQRIIRLEDGRVVYDGDAHAPEAVVQPNLVIPDPVKPQNETKQEGSV